jgi:hypothetical protein
MSRQRLPSDAETTGVEEAACSSRPLMADQATSTRSHRFWTAQHSRPERADDVVDEGGLEASVRVRSVGDRPGLLEELKVLSARAHLVVVCADGLAALRLSG